MRFCISSRVMGLEYEISVLTIANVFDRHADARSQKFIHTTAKTLIIEKETSDEINTLMADVEKHHWCL